MSVQGGSRPRGPGVTFGIVTVVLLVLLATFALSSRQPPPPTIAEFAPQAVEQITESPNDQSSSVGRGAGLGAEGDGGGLDALVADIPQAMDVARVRRCVGDPPRQIEDPQSPPCVPYWSGDNGGDTWKGVTRDSIRVLANGYDPLIESFFNRRFEFYGRKIVTLGETGNQSGSDSDPAINRAAAVATDEQYHAFAGLNPNADNGGDYHEELVRRQLMGVEYQAFYTEDWLAQRAPYIWEYQMSADRTLIALAGWACSRLHGRLARFAGDPLYQRTTRVFGLIFQPMEGNPFNTEPFEKTFKERCNGEIRARATFNSLDSPTNGILQLKNAGVTSVIALTNVTATGLFTKSATSQGYLPEWLLTSYAFNDESFHAESLNGNKEQLAHTFGNSVQPKHVTPQDSPSWWAMKESDPAAGLEEQQTGLVTSGRNGYYRSMLLFASGVQMAGPHLTPETFSQGLQRTAFPNPDTPLMAGNVGFQDGDHSMINDVAEWWWSNADAGPYTDSHGAICYVNHGERRTANTWESGDDPFFKPPCDYGANA